MDHRIRRVVTTHDDNGKAVVLFDGIAPNTRVRKIGGFVSTLLWVTDASPARLSGSQDRADVSIGVAPPPNGAVFRIVDFPPIAGDLTAVDRELLLRDMGVTDAVQAGRAPRHPFTHRTNSVDFAIVLRGEIDMLLDDSDVHLGAGDVVVQQGTNHAWVNRGVETCRIAFVLIDAEEL
jgi:mannose-6-phosphate isomerase-like protein (cupin superfamily)